MDIDVMERTPVTTKDIEFKVSPEPVVKSSIGVELAFGNRRREIPPQARAKLEQQMQDSRDFFHETY